jgi:hypothetical protein
LLPFQDSKWEGGRVVGGKSQRNGLPPHFPLCDAKESKKCAKSVYKKVLSLSLSPSFFTIYIQNAKLDFIVVIKVMCT